jgi:hypothetical protein
MGIELYPQSTSLVFWRRCRPLQFQMEPSGVKFGLSLGSALVCLRGGPGGEGGIPSTHPKEFSVAMVKRKFFVVNEQIVEKPFCQCCWEI